MLIEKKSQVQGCKSKTEFGIVGFEEPKLEFNFESTNLNCCVCTIFN